MTKEMFISTILTVEAIIKYEMLHYNMNYKQVTRNIYLDILPTMYHEELMVKKKLMILQKSNLKSLFVN